MTPGPVELLRASHYEIQIIFCFVFQMLADSLLECRKNSSQLLELRVFACGNGRLENAGAIALAEAFKVIYIIQLLSHAVSEVLQGHSPAQS